MSISAADLRMAWATLPVAFGDQLNSYPLEVRIGANPIRVALDGQGNRHLLVPADGEKVPSDDRRTVLTLTQRDLVFGGVRLSYVDVECSEAELSAEFDELVSDVIGAVVGSPTPALQTRQVIGRWRRMFRTLASRHFTEAERVGLFAELSVLAALHRKDQSTGAAHWTGPNRDKHDFELASSCVEVKGLGPTSESIKVHGLEQLASHEDRPLTLLLVTVEQSPVGLSLSELVREVAELLDSDPHFPLQLGKTGWTVDDVASRDMRYVIAGAASIGVDERVPRIAPSSFVAGSVDEGITQVTYSVAVDALRPHAVVANLEQVAENIAAGA